MTAVPLSVEIGAGGTVIVRYGDVAWTLPADSATRFGRAMIAAAVASTAGDPPPTGTHVADAHLPVTAWKTGVSNVNMEPILMMELRGGLWMSFQLPHTSAKEMGQALSNTGSTGGRPAGQLLS
jgi:hypothetical protein